MPHASATQPSTSFECALVGAARFNAAHFSAERFERVVAVDGGFSSLTTAQAHADIAIGDFDSLGFEPEGLPVVRHPVMKDDSDTALALEWAHEHGIASVAVYGALGGRLDHTLATEQALVAAARSGMRVVAVDETCLVIALSAHAPAPPARLALPALEGGNLSVFSMSDISHGLTETGLLYEAGGVDLSNDVTLGLSNEFVGEPARIEIADGDVLVFAPLMPLSMLVFG